MKLISTNYFIESRITANFRGIGEAGVSGKCSGGLRNRDQSVHLIPNTARTLRIREIRGIPLNSGNINYNLQ